MFLKQIQAVELHFPVHLMFSEASENNAQVPSRKSMRPSGRHVSHEIWWGDWAKRAEGCGPPTKIPRG